MSFHIYHAIRSLGVGGGQTMLFELHEAFKRYHPDITQSICLLNSRNVSNNFVEGYRIKYDTFTEAEFSKRILKHGGPCVVLYHKLMTTSTDFLRPVQGRVPIIVLNHTHTKSVSYNRIRNADQVIAVCQNMKSNLMRMRVPAPIEVILNGVNGDRFINVSAINRNEDNILLSGRINALNRIKYSDDWINWCLGVDLPQKMVHEYMGGGAFLRDAQKLIDNFSQPKNDVRLLGNIPDFNKKISRLKSWDIFLYEINRDEGLSIAVLEALASGVPVVCSNHYGNKEIIKDGINGFVFRNRDELENILTEICIQPDMLADLRQTTLKDFQDNLDSKITVGRYRSVIEKVIKNYGRKPNSKAVTIRKPPETKRKKIPPQIHSTSKRQKIMIEDTPQAPPPRPAPQLNNKFTVLTASYNNAAWLDEWSGSILRQNYRPLEVVFVDDANTDSTPDIIEQLKPKFKDAGIVFKSIRNEKRLYCASAYQVGFNQAEGSFMGVLDSDDMLTPDAVEYIMNLYQQYPEVGWIYTQYETCARNMAPKHKGFCRLPDPGMSLLDMGKKGKHAYSHWRTFSHRVPKLGKIWKAGLACAVDKYMGYRLEEWSTGMFADRICYKYREGVKHSISTQGKSKIVWRQIIAEAETRRKRYQLKAHPILEHKE